MSCQQTTFHQISSEQLDHAEVCFSSLQVRPKICGNSYARLAGVLLPLLQIPCLRGSSISVVRLATLPLVTAITERAWIAGAFFGTCTGGFLSFRALGYPERSPRYGPRTTVLGTPPYILDSVHFRSSKAGV